MVVLPAVPMVVLMEAPSGFALSAVWVLVVLGVALDTPGTGLPAFLILGSSSLRHLLRNLRVREESESKRVKRVQAKLRTVKIKTDKTSQCSQMSL